MQHIAPLGPVYQAGTLSGNPLAVSAGVATVEQLNRDLYATLEDKTKQLVEGLGSILTNAGIPHASNRVGSMFTIFFSEKAPQNFEDVQQTDLERFKKFFHAMLEEGVYTPMYDPISNKQRIFGTPPNGKYWCTYQFMGLLNQLCEMG